MRSSEDRTSRKERRRRRRRRHLLVVTVRMAKSSSCWSRVAGARERRATSSCLLVSEMQLLILGPTSGRIGLSETLREARRGRTGEANMARAGRLVEMKARDDDEPEESERRTEAAQVTQEEEHKRGQHRK
eukprot:724685-Hanusia_phi.AAC.1